MDAATFELIDAFAVGTVIVPPVKSCVPVHVAPAFIVFIAVLIAPVVNAVDAAFVVFVPAVAVGTVIVAPVKF